MVQATPSPNSPDRSAVQSNIARLPAVGEHGVVTLAPALGMLCLGTNPKIPCHVRAQIERLYTTLTASDTFAERKDDSGVYHLTGEQVRGVIACAAIAGALQTAHDIGGAMNEIASLEAQLQANPGAHDGA